jgi:AcrR family transcriptional regulator
MVIKQRAVRQEQKIERRQAILAAARVLFERTPYPDISMQQVAGHAALAKGTLYLYFKTKEELFLALLEQELAGWFDEMDAWLSGLNDDGQTCTRQDFVARLAGSLAGREIAIRLIVISQAILERNIAYATALSYKQLLHDRMQHTGAKLEACLPFLSSGLGARLILWIYLLIIGVQSAAEPAPLLRQALEEPGLQALRVDFQTEIQRILSVLIDGLACSADYVEVNK